MAHHESAADFSIERLLREDCGATKQKQRRRSSFSALQVHWLETEFRFHRYVSPERRAGLATLLGLTQQQIKIWFQNRRYKTKFRLRRAGSRPDAEPVVSDAPAPAATANPGLYPSLQHPTDIQKLFLKPNAWNDYCLKLLLGTPCLNQQKPHLEYARDCQDRSH